MFDNISIGKIKADEENVEFHKPDTFLISYHEFLEYFNNLEKIEKHHLIIGINFTYGWMPTIFHFKSKSDNYNEAIEILNKVKKECNYCMSNDDLTLLIKLFNNSLVGTSKLLHFINPENYAIWDSRVCRYLMDGNPTSYNQFIKPAIYKQYLNFCTRLTSEKSFLPIHNSIIKKVGYHMTKFRTLELTMFMSSSK